MPTDPAAATATDSQKAMDDEHLVQLGLIDALVEALGDASANDSPAELLARFVDFTELHFMSEQVLMRQHAYPEYAEHVADHEALIERLHALRDGLADGDDTPSTEQALRIKGEMMGHIRNRDAALHAYLADLVGAHG
jgi:hemerythrin